MVIQAAVLGKLAASNPWAALGIAAGLGVGLWLGARKLRRDGRLQMSGSWTWPEYAKGTRAHASL